LKVLKKHLLQIFQINLNNSNQKSQIRKLKLQPRELKKLKKGILKKQRDIHSDFQRNIMGKRRAITKWLRKLQVKRGKQ
jgi:hypothetical protein